MCAARHAHAVPLLALRCINSGSLAIFAAIRRASSFVMEAGLTASIADHQ
jgi:hypothetical protein